LEVKASPLEGKGWRQSLRLLEVRGWRLEAEPEAVGGWRLEAEPSAVGVGERLKPEAKRPSNLTPPQAIFGGHRNYAEIYFSI
jgi:hypothetical protein